MIPDSITNLHKFLLVMKGYRTVKLLQTFVVRSLGYWITVPVGFVSDLANIPRIFWWFVAPWGKIASAAIVHDRLYHTGELSRQEADLVFLDLMLRLNVPWYQRELVYWSVRIGGRAAWKRSRKVQKDEEAAKVYELVNLSRENIKEKTR